MFAFSKKVCYNNKKEIIIKKIYEIERMRTMSRTSDKGPKILNYIEEQTRLNGYPPSVREIGEAVGLSSTSSVHAQLASLRKNGYLEKHDSKTRALRLTDKYYHEFGDYTSDDFEPVSAYSQSEYLEVPIVGRVAAGQPILAIEEATDTLPLPMSFAKNKDLFILTVSGESMIEAAILDGDMVIVQKQSTAMNGDIVVALIEDSATVKTFYKENGHFRLQPENSTMEPIIVDSVTILGKVVGLFRTGI